MAPICVNCNLQMRVVQAGAPVELMVGQKPYQMWMGDRFQCTSCGIEVIAQFGKEAVKQANEPDYEAVVSNFRNVQRFWTKLLEADSYRHWAKRNALPSTSTEGTENK